MTKTHGLTNTPEYEVWCGVKKRCGNPKSTNYRRYGQRGIMVCERWQHDFPAFLADMGPRPTPLHTIERIDNDGHYEPSNCRWATRSEQAYNRNTSDFSRLLTLNGITQTITAWARDLSVSRQVINQRLKHGWSIEQALSVPRLDPRQRPRSRGKFIAQ